MDTERTASGSYIVVRFTAPHRNGGHSPRYSVVVRLLGVVQRLDDDLLAPGQHARVRRHPGVRRKADQRI